MFSPQYGYDLTSLEGSCLSSASSMADWGGCSGTSGESRRLGKK